MTPDIKKEEAVIHEGKIFALISYLFILCVIPLILKKDNKFALFHAKQGLVLFVGEVTFFILSVLPLIGKFIYTLGILVFGLLSLWGIIQALMGNYTKLPVIYVIAERIIL